MTAPEAKDQTLVERVARAIEKASAKAGLPAGSHHHITPLPIDACRDLARAAIAAHETALRAAGLVIVPREPTDAMIDACHEATVFEDDGLSAQDYHDQPRVAWRAMIDSALAEETK